MCWTTVIPALRSRARRVSCSYSSPSALQARNQPGLCEILTLIEKQSISWVPPFLLGLGRTEKEQEGLEKKLGDRISQGPLRVSAHSFGICKEYIGLSALRPDHLSSIFDAKISRADQDLLVHYQRAVFLLVLCVQVSAMDSSHHCIGLRVFGCWNHLPSTQDKLTHMSMRASSRP